MPTETLTFQELILRLQTFWAGKGCVVLQPAGEQPTLLAHAITRELELVGSFRFRDEIDDVVAALGDGLALDAAITHEVDVTDTAAVLDAFGTARDASVSGKVLLRF